MTTDAVASPHRLAALRIISGAVAVGYLLARFPELARLADRSPARFESVGVLVWLGEPLSSSFVRVLLVVTIAAGVGYLLGWRYRLAGPLFAAALLVLTTYHGSWGQLLHFENLMWMHVAVFAFAPAADVWALDAGGRGVRPADVRYGWPVRLAAIITVTTYFIAGVAKLRYGGIDWMLGDTLRNHVAYSAARLDLLGAEPSPAASALVASSWLFPPMAIATVAIELGAPVALWSARVGRWWSGAAWFMHVGILVMMLVVFHYPLLGAAFAPFFRAERFVSRVLPFCRLPVSGMSVSAQ